MASHTSVFWTRLSRAQIPCPFQNPQSHSDSVLGEKPQRCGSCSLGDSVSSHCFTGESVTESGHVLGRRCDDEGAVSGTSN